MKEFLLGFFRGSLFTVVVCLWLYMIPYFIRKGWGDAVNNTKKACDLCFRDIEKWNKIVEEYDKQKSHERHTTEQDS